MNRAMETNISRLADLIRSDAWSAFDMPPEWGCSIFVPHSFLKSEVVESLNVGAGVSRRAIPSELVRVNLDGIADIPFADIIRTLLRREIEPFIIGVGEVIVEDEPEGLVIGLGNRRDKLSGHDAPIVADVCAL